MPYVGNEPTSNFASVTKDLFSGDGSTTAFTLSKAATTNGVAVFVENVRQEPTTAYAVSGTTLTFTAAPVSSSGNNIYVLHHNAPASTAIHSAAQPLTATSGTFTGDVSFSDNNITNVGNIQVDSISGDSDTNTSIDFEGSDITTFNQGGSEAMRLDASGNLSIGNGANTNDGAIHINAGAGAKNIVLEGDRDTEGQGIGNVQYHSAGTNVVQISAERGSTDAKGDLVFYTNGGSLTARMRIDEDGHITKPTQSAFLVKMDSNQTDIAINTNHTVECDTEIFDQNSDFNTSTYTFTAPVTGRYQLNFSVYLYQVDEGADYYVGYINSSNRGYKVILDPGGFDGDINYLSFMVSALADMDANDTAYGTVYQDDGSQQTDIIGLEYTYFSGYLVA